MYAETIPFTETRDYVKKVMANASYYGHVLSQQLQSLKQRVGVIGARNPANEPSLSDTP
jgi:soluble lytic murein transglycosylase